MINTVKIFIKSFVIIGFSGFLFQESLSATGAGAIEIEEMQRRESAAPSPAAIPPSTAVLSTLLTPDLPTATPQHVVAPQEGLWTQVEASLDELTQAASDAASEAWEGFAGLFKVPSFTVPACFAVNLNLDNLRLGNEPATGNGDRE